MQAAKRNAAAKKTTAKSTAKRVRKPRTPAKPLTPELREFAAKVVGFATETAMGSELKVKRNSQAELNGVRSGMVSRMILDNGTRVQVTVAVRQK